MHSPYVNDLELVRTLEKGRVAVYTAQQVASMLSMPPRSARVRLSRMVKNKVLVRLMRDRYALPSADILAVASGIYRPSYVSLLAAFEHYGTTTQSPRVIDIITPVYSGNVPVDLETGRFELRFVRVSPSLMYGYVKVDVKGGKASVAEKERAIVDALLLPGYVPLDEAVACIRSGIDQAKAVDYARRTGRQAVMKRLGYLLSEYGSGEGLGAQEEFSKTYVPLNPGLPRRGRFDSKFRVIVNRVIE
jgi:predicted transcriptional regulator of viral defense system